MLAADAIRKLVALQVLEVDVEDPGGTKDRRDPLFDYVDATTDKIHGHLNRLHSSRVAVLGKGAVARGVCENLAPLGLEKILHSNEENGTDGALERIAVESDDDLTSDAFSEKLAGADLLIACADDAVERLRLFPLVNQIALRHRLPWISGYADGDEVFVGPLFIPYETGCFHCLETREEACLANVEEYRAFKMFVRSGSALSSAPALPMALTIAGGSVASEAMRCLARLSFPLSYQTLIELNVLTWETRHHTLLRIPFCDLCGSHVERPLRYPWGL